MQFSQLHTSWLHFHKILPWSTTLSLIAAFQRPNFIYRTFAFKQLSPDLSKWTFLLLDRFSGHEFDPQVALSWSLRLDTASYKTLRNFLYSGSPNRLSWVTCTVSYRFPSFQYFLCFLSSLSLKVHFDRLTIDQCFHQTFFAITLVTSHVIHLIHTQS